MDRASFNNPIFGRDLHFLFGWREKEVKGGEGEGEGEGGEFFYLTWL